MRLIERSQECADSKPTPHTTDIRDPCLFIWFIFLRGDKVPVKLLCASDTNDLQAKNAIVKVASNLV